MSNVEGMYSINLKKRLSRAKPSFEILRFDIRYSAVRCSIQARPSKRLFDHNADINLGSLIRGVRKTNVTAET